MYEDGELEKRKGEETMKLEFKLSFCLPRYLSSTNIFAREMKEIIILIKPF